MPNDPQQAKEAVRKLVGSALVDLVAYLGTLKDPIIVGGQYPNDKLVAAMRKWLFERKFDIEDINESAKTWLLMCFQGIFSGDKNFVKPPTPPKQTEPLPPPQPPLKQTEPLPPLPQSPPHDAPPPPHANDAIPDDGFFKEDGWKPEEDQKERWQDEGEDWKKGGGFDDDFQPS